MDIIKEFYERIREKQMLNVFVQAQKRKYEYIPFIENNTLVQNIFYQNIPIASTVILNHISDVMCSPYKKRKIHKVNDNIQINNECKITKIEKYSHYVFKKINEDKFIIQLEKNIDKLEDGNQDDSKSKLGIGITEDKIENLDDVSKYMDIFKTDNDQVRRQFITNILKVVMGKDYVEEKADYTDYQDYIKAKKELTLKGIENELEEACLGAKQKAKDDLEDGIKMLQKNVFKIIESNYEKYKLTEHDKKYFREIIEDELVKNLPIIS